MIYSSVDAVSLPPEGSTFVADDVKLRRGLSPHRFDPRSHTEPFAGGCRRPLVQCGCLVWRDPGPCPVASSKSRARVRLCIVRASLTHSRFFLPRRRKQSKVDFERQSADVEPMVRWVRSGALTGAPTLVEQLGGAFGELAKDRKSTRLNSSHS